MRRLFLCLAFLSIVGVAAKSNAWDFGFNFGSGSTVRFEDLLPSLSWSGSGVGWSTNAYEYGSRDTGTSTRTTFVITNSGNDTAEDVATTVTGTGFRLYSTTTFGNISSGKTRVVKVAFEPSTAGAKSGFANYSAPNIARRQVALSGTGVTGGPDSTPNAFTFTDQTGVALSTLITSAPITVTGIDTAATITVTGGAYDINSSGTFVTTAGTVSSGNTVRAQHTSSGSESTAVNTVVTIGGVSDTFTSTTVGGTAALFAWGMESNSFPVTSDVGGVPITRYGGTTGTMGTVVTGHTGNALSQNATNFTYWYLPGTVLSEATGKIDLWVKHDTASGTGTADQRPLFTNAQTTNGIAAYFISSSSSFYFIIYDSTGGAHRVFTTTDSWAAGTWYHYELEWNATAGTMSAKRNGTPFTTSSNGLANWSSVLPNWDAYTFRIGSTYPIGAIDEFIIY